MCMDFRAAVDRAMELAVVPSFTRIGPALRARLFAWGEPARADGRRVVLTGATSGLGLAAARRLAALGAELTVVVRDAERGERLAEELGGDTRVHEVDLSDLAGVRAAGERIGAEGPVDVLVHNAGALYPRRRSSAQGYELTFATMVLAPHLLTRTLVPALERAARARPPARVIWVASGGMYLERLHLDDLLMERAPYRGSVAYAHAKRAQVVLARAWADRLADRDVVVHAMHPGWADTPGVARSLPTFRRVMGPLLRTPEEGADTMVWLALAEEPGCSTGGFWHDRRERPVDHFPWTRVAWREREELWRRCEELVDGL